MIDKFSTIFDGLRLAYGTFKIEDRNAKGKATGKAMIVREERTQETWQMHLDGTQSVGIIPINEDNQCRWGCIDIDEYNFDHTALINKLKNLKLPLVVCRSKSGGAHVFLFTDDFIPAKDMQDVLTRLSVGLGYGGSEIFPKQIALNLDRGDVGNFLNMPYFDHENSLRYAFKPDSSAATIEEFFELVAENVQTREQALALIVEQDSSLPIQDGPPCLQTLCKDGIGEGARNNGLFNVGVYLRKAFPDTWESEILQHNMQFIHPPLPLGEVNSVAKQLLRKDYAYKCKDAPINSVCNKELCMTRKFGIEAVVSGVQIANLRKYNSVPPVWFLDVEGKPLEMGTDDLLNQMAFQRACVEQLNFYPRTMKKDMWETRINALLTEMQETDGSIIEVSEDVSVNGIFNEHLEEFCTGHQAAEEKEQILLKRPWTDEEKNETYFRLKDLEGHLLKANFKHFKTHQIAQRLRDINGEATQLRIQSKVVRLWKIPAHKVTKTVIRDPRFTADEEVPF
jgi:hypothetical protein